MNLVIPYRHEVSNGLELKFALRSIESYLTGYNQIFIVGDRFPTWLTNTQIVYFEEDKRKSSTNILKKILAGMYYAGPQVIQWQDDIFLNKPLDVKDFKYWYDGTMADAIKKSRGNYKQLVVDTALKTTDEFLYYDTHTPIIYNEAPLRGMMEKLEWGKKEFIIKTSYVWYRKPYTPGEYLQDCKIMMPTKLHEPEEKIKDRLFFSTQGLETHVIDMLEKLYPNKSRYEI